MTLTFKGSPAELAARMTDDDLNSRCPNVAARRREMGSKASDEHIAAATTAGERYSQREDLGGGMPTRPDDK
ncbi:MAG: hypothetical protein QOC62_1257 [Mycobacterium sp.]|jgi:hypothetical protein|nr:hypothetical protein [Mycobacterium sp.]